MGTVAPWTGLTVLAHPEPLLTSPLPASRWPKRVTLPSPKSPHSPGGHGKEADEKSCYGVRNGARFFHPLQEVKLLQGSDPALTVETAENSRQRL